MKLKHLVTFGVLLALLAIAVVFKAHQKPAELTTEPYAPIGLAIDADKVAGIEIGKGKDAKLVELKKSDAGEWTIPTFLGARADKNKIGDLMKTLKDAQGELRGKDKALFPDFGIADDTGFRVAFFDKTGKSVLTFFLGTKKTRYETAFLRRSGSDDVYFTAADLLEKMGLFDDPEKESPKSDFWAELRLIAAKTDQVDELVTKRFTGGQETVTTHVRRETDPNDPAKKKWRFMRDGLPFAIDAGKLKQYFESWQSRPASKVLDPKAKDYGFSAPKWQMKLHQENGEEILVTVGAEDPETKGVYVQVSNDPVVFLLPKYYFTSADIDDSKFFIDDPLAVDPDRTSELVIHADATELQFSPQGKKQEPVTQYMNKMKNFKVERLLFDPAETKKVRSGGRHWVKLLREGGVPVIIDAGEPLTADHKEYAAQKRDSTQAFVISESTFKNIFEDLAALKTVS